MYVVPEWDARDLQVRRAGRQDDVSLDKSAPVGEALSIL